MKHLLEKSVIQSINCFVSKRNIHLSETNYFRKRHFEKKEHKILKMDGVFLFKKNHNLDIYMIGVDHCNPKSRFILSKVQIF